MMRKLENLRRSCSSWTEATRSAGAGTEESNWLALIAALAAGEVGDVVTKITAEHPERRRVRLRRRRRCPRGARGVALWGSKFATLFQLA